MNNSIRNNLSERIFHTIRSHSDRILLSDDSVNFTGTEISAFIHEIRQNIDFFSRKRGRIGILIPNSAVLAVSILAVIALGRIPVILDPSARRKHTESLLPKLNLDFLIVSKAAYPELDSPCSFISMNTSGGMTFVTRNDVTKSDYLPRDGTSIILYTSGSEGEPKGAQLSESGMRYTLDYLIDSFGLNESAVSACIMPLCHAMGLITQFLPTFLAGGKCVFFDISMSLGIIYRQIIRSECTFTGFITEFLQLCHEEKTRRGLEPALKVQHIQISGGPVLEDHLRKAMLLFPNAIIHKAYGLTEAVRISTISSSDPKFFSNAAGYILPGQEVQIRDKCGCTLPFNTVGRIYVRGPNVMLGYDNITGDFPGVDGFLDTGDIGLLTPDNCLFIHGRHDSIFKINGERVSGCEIENAARFILPYFRDVKCQFLEQNGRIRPVLFIELYPVRSENVFTELKNGFREALLKKLASKLKMPDEIYLMQNFPRTYNGKIRHKELKDIVKSQSAEYLGKDGSLSFFYCPDNMAAGLCGACIRNKGMN
jgi:acyl-CoA synthetase (AMP-forming)/AMP-acid ligase II